MSVIPNERIVKTSGTCGGRARIAGHRVRVQDIVIWCEYQGMTPDEIISHIPSITLADVHSALAYYFDHVQEIQEEIERIESMLTSSFVTIRSWPPRTESGAVRSRQSTGFRCGRQVLTSPHPRSESTHPADHVCSGERHDPTMPRVHTIHCRFLATTSRSRLEQRQKPCPNRWYLDDSE